MVIEITQVDWDGKGNNRTFTKYATGHNLQQKLESVRRAYNLNSTRVTVDGLAVNWAMV